jgi:tRNA A37 N6-isopentenylltransferase MiaA
MKRSVIVFGPKGSGKTHHAEQLRKHFGMEHIVDDWDGSRTYPTFGALVLTNNAHPRIAARGNYYVLNKALLKAAGAVTA